MHKQPRGLDRHAHLLLVKRQRNVFECIPALRVLIALPRDGAQAACGVLPERARGAVGVQAGNCSEIAAGDSVTAREVPCGAALRDAHEGLAPADGVLKELRILDLLCLYIGGI